MQVLTAIWLAASGLAGADISADTVPTSSAAYQPGQQEILVVADRPHGETPGAIASETRMDSAAIQALGATNLADILTQITALTGGSQARAGDGPVLLVNGRRIGSFDEVRNLPPEAIERVDILPEEAALRLGYPARSKPVNIVLKPYYAALTGELEDRVTTAGLRNDFNTEFNAVRIKGDNRLTLDLQYQTGNAITEAKRGVVRPLDALAASRAGILSASGGGALLPLAQAFVGVPASARSLAAFAATPAADDTGAWRTLTPATQQLTANTAYARALGGGQTLSLNAKYDRLSLQEMLGPAIADLTLPATAPFAVPLHLRQVLPDMPGQTRNTRTDTLHASAQWAGTGRWRWSLAGAFDHIALTRDKHGGADASAWQSAINAGAVADPFAAPSSAYLAVKPDSHASSRDNTAGLDSFLSGPVARLPAGKVNLTLGAKLSREVLDSLDGSGAHRLSRNYASGQLALDAPLLSAHSPVGALDGGINVSVDRWSDAGTVNGYGANLNWKPHKRLSILLSATRDAMAPTMAQLGAPQDVSPQVAIYDYATGRSVTAAQVTGGDAGLRADTRRIWKAQAEWKPLTGLALTGTYTQMTISNPLMAFAGISPLFEAAFPGRVSRDALGNIASFDARPFNADREERQEARLAAVFSRSFGKGTGPAVPGKGGFGGGHSFGAGASMVQFSLVDTIRLSDRLTLAAGGPAYDLVGANPLGEAARAPRHRVDAQLSATHHGWGLRAGGVWTSGGRDGVGSTGTLDFADRFAFNFRLFWFPERNPAIARAAPYMHGVRFLLAVDNLFDSWQRVRDAGGATPLAYQRWILDPMGRTVRLSIRKTLD